MQYSEQLTTTNGTDFTLITGGTIIGLQYLDLSTQRLSGGTLRYSATGTYTPKLGATIIDFSQAGTYNLNGADISGAILLTNSSGGDITVNLAGGVSYDIDGDTTITVIQDVAYTGLSFSELVEDSQVYIFETGTQTVIDYVEESDTTFEWSEEYDADQTVDYTIIKAGYTPIRVTSVPCGNTVTPITIQQTVDRAYVDSSGLTYGTNASYNASTYRFSLSVASTLQNYYSFMIESFRDQATLKNKQFPIIPNGSNSFSLEGAEFDNSTSIAYLSRDGLRYTDGGTCIACWAAILTSGVPSGLQVTYQQVDGSGTTDTANTGNMDELIQVSGDATHGNFDYRSFLVLKVQADGYDQAEADVVATYGTLGDEFYVVGLAPTLNGLATGNPSVTGLTITDHAGSPVTWNGKAYSLTITDSATAHTGTEIMRWLRYNYSLGGTFQSKDAFNWHDLVQTNGDKFKTVRGAIYGDTGATLKGVRVLMNDGTTMHPDFNAFTADDGSTYTPPVYLSQKVSGLAANTRIQLYDTLNSEELYNGIPTYPFTWIEDSAYSVDREIRLRHMLKSGVTAKKFGQVNLGTLTDESPSGSTLQSQETDLVYAANNIDGSTVTGVSIDDANLLLNISGTEFTWQELYAYETDWLYSEEGIRDEGRFIEAKDTANYILYNFKIKNVGTTPINISGGYGVDSDGSADWFDTTGLSIFPVVPHVVPTTVYSTGDVVISGDIDDVTAKVQAGMTAQGYTTARGAALDGLATETNATKNRNAILGSL